MLLNASKKIENNPSCLQLQHSRIYGFYDPHTRLRNFCTAQRRHTADKLSLSLRGKKSSVRSYILQKAIVVNFSKFPLENLIARDDRLQPRIPVCADR